MTYIWMAVEHVYKHRDTQTLILQHTDEQYTDVTLGSTLKFFTKCDIPFSRNLL